MVPWGLFCAPGVENETAEKLEEADAADLRV
jgi:hypothetical protein